MIVRALMVTAQVRCDRDTANGRVQFLVIEGY